MRGDTAQTTTVRDVGLLIVTGFALLAGTALMLIARATAQTVPADVAHAQEPVSVAQEQTDFSAYAVAVSDHAEGAMMGGSMGTADVHGYGSLLCWQNFIKPESCFTWLIGEFADGSCREAGIFTKGGCERFLTDRNGGTFPGCGTLNALECDERKALTTIEMLQDDVFAEVDRIIAEAVAEKVAVTLPALSSLPPEQIGQARWWASDRAEGQQTARGVVVLDADRDGLPDDYERSIGTDPGKADTDKDGVDDSTELRQGTDPKGRGPLGRTLSSTEKAIVSGRPLQQPAAMAWSDAGMTVRATNGEGVSGKAMLSGTCDPGGICIIYVYSYVPTVRIVAADASGNWQVDLSDMLTDGHHAAYVAVTDDTGKITKRSDALSFFVNDAQAVTFNDFVSMNAVPSNAIAVRSPANTQKTFIYGALALVTFATVLIIAILRKRPSAG